MKEAEFLQGMRERVRENKSPVSTEKIDLDKFRNPKEEQPFKKTFLTSVFGHSSLLIAVLIFPYVMSMFGVQNSYDEKFKKRDLKNAIRVDMVGLPTKKLIDLEKIDPTQDMGIEKKIEKPKPSDTAMKLQEEKKIANSKKALAKKRKNRLAELRASMKIEQKRKQLIKELKGGSAPSTQGRAPLAGNIVSQGYSVTGDVAGDMDVYQGHLKAHIRKAWNLPGWMEASNLSAKVLVKLAPNGKILKYEFVKKSGNGEFDGHVLNAIKEAEPFPVPPPSLQRVVMEDGVEWGFPQ